MKILTFETKDHPILGNCKLDFSRNGLFSDFVLLAGSNGSGKTTILNELFDFLTNISLRSLNYDIKLSFHLNLEEINELKKINEEIDEKMEIEMLRTGDPDTGWNKLKIFNSQKEMFQGQSHVLVNNKQFKELFKCVYSTVEINFSNSNIASTTATDIDRITIPKEKSTASISQEIMQLLVDISALDDSDAASWVRQKIGQTVEVVKHEERISRFKKAFDYMIESKTFQGVKNEENRKKVYFNDASGNEIDIPSLSSGEKQIVFRAGYLLKNIRTLSGGIILIDEPEISLHPSWQEKYVNFLRSIFADEHGVQMQFIIATHSPFIIQNESITDEKIIILEKHNNNTIEVDKPVFYGYRQPEPIFVAIAHNTKPLLLVEGESDKHIISHAWTILYPGIDMYFDIKWAGEPNTGGAGLVQRQLVTLQQHATEKILGLFDADKKGLEEHSGTKTKPLDFQICPLIPSLKILNKVGATYLPMPALRENYFNLQHPNFSLLTLELFFEDSILETLNILEPQKIKIGSEELVKIKTNHKITANNLAALKNDDFAQFAVLFDHIQQCFNNIK